MRWPGNILISISVPVNAHGLNIRSILLFFIADNVKVMAGAKQQRLTAAGSVEDLSEYTDADESISAPTEFLAEVHCQSQVGLFSVIDVKLDAYHFHSV